MVGYACPICIYCPGYFLVTKRLFPPAPGGTCKASPVELGKTPAATQPPKMDQGEFSKTATACYSASKAYQGDFNEANSGCREISKSTQPSSVPPLPPRKPEQNHSPTSASQDNSGTVEQETEPKFNAAEAKAKREGVHSLTSEDIEGLSDEQIKQLRGY